MPTSSPRPLNSSAPLWSGRAGAVKRAPARGYSQQPEKLRRDSSCAALTAPSSPPLTIISGSPRASAAALP
ncbi:MAG: hypothetical protein U1E72_06625 [Burkholderiaceae bacterium]